MQSIEMACASASELDLPGKLEAGPKPGEEASAMDKREELYLLFYRVRVAYVQEVGTWYFETHRSASDRDVFSAEFSKSLTAVSQEGFKLILSYFSRIVRPNLELLGKIFTKEFAEIFEEELTHVRQNMPKGLEGQRVVSALSHLRMH